MKRRVLSRAKRADALRAAFQQAAAREHRGAAQVMQRMMLAYVTLQRNVQPGSESHRAGLERCAAALAITSIPEDAARLLRTDAELEAMVHRQVGWYDSRCEVG